MKNNDVITYVCIFAIIICVIYLLMRLFGFFSTQDENVTSQEVEGPDDNPYLKALTEFRQQIINEIIRYYAGIIRADIEQISVTPVNVGFNANVIDVLFTNELLRIYCYWELKKIKITYSFVNDEEEKYFKKTFRIVNKHIDFDAIEKFLRNKHKKLFDTNELQNKKECFKAAKEITSQKDFNEKQATNLLLDMWHSIRFNKHKFSDLDAINFTRLTAYLTYMKPQELIDSLKDKNKTDK